MLGQSDAQHKGDLPQRLGLSFTGSDSAANPAPNSARILKQLFSSQTDCGREYGREIRAVEKLGLYYVVLNSSLVNARQIREFAVRAVQRVPPGEDRLKYDNLFIAGDPENKRFWLEVNTVANDLINKYVQITD